MDDSPRPKRARQNRFTGKLLMIPFLDRKGINCIKWVPHSQVVNKEYYVGVLRELSKRFRRKMPITLQISLVAPAPGQRTLPQVHHGDGPPD